MIRIEHGQFKDEHGRTLILRGVNLGGSSKVPLHPDGADQSSEAFFAHRTVSFVGRPFPLDEADEHFARLRSWGFTFLRFLVTWEAIEHAGPGIYDEAYLDYVAAVVAKAGHHGINLLIDPHQDVWSRLSGGDGAPGWTFDVVGMDPRQFGATGSALVQQVHGDRFPPMSWPSNGSKLAAATLFTLFFGGSTFAPTTQVAGESAQTYLQHHYFEAIKQLAIRLRGLPHVIGYDTMNEPLSGFIGLTDLEANQRAFPMGENPTPFQAMLLGAGFPQMVEVRGGGLAGLILRQRRLVNRDGVQVWRHGTGCIWRQHGVWDVDKTGSPQLLQPGYFGEVNGNPVDFTQDYYVPFANRFAQEIRSVDPDALIFVQTEVSGPVPRWTDRDADQIVYAPHWYDVFTLFLKQFSPFAAFDMWRLRPVFGTPGLIRRALSAQLRHLKAAAGQRMGSAPVLLGEFGIPFDLDNRRAYRTGNFDKQIMAMDRSMRAVEDALMNATLWNYTADNSNRHGDHWNGEDLSIFSRDQQADPADINSGGRALAAVVRPYAVAVAGEPTRLSFNYRNGCFEFEFRHDPAVSEPTEIFVPRVHYPEHIDVHVSDGTVTYLPEQQCLIYRHAPETLFHSLRITPAPAR